MSVEPTFDKDQPSGYVELGGGRECEDLLLADAVGLQNLIRACRVALDVGEYRGQIGVFSGIRHQDELQKSGAQSTDVLDLNCFPGHLVPGDEYVNFLVGNTFGLENLIRACETALEKGQYNGYDIGSFIGVRNWETSFFEGIG